MQSPVISRKLATCLTFSTNLRAGLAEIFLRLHLALQTEQGDRWRNALTFSELQLDLVPMVEEDKEEAVHPPMRHPILQKYQ